MENRKLLHLKNLIIIALADGKLDPLEKEFIIEKGSILGIDEKELDLLFAEALEFKNKLFQIEMSKEEQMADAVLMAVLDGYIHENEQKILMELAEVLGFTKEYVDQIIKKSFELWKKSD
jgi:DnaJ-domain-containing protein 1